MRDDELDRILGADEDVLPSSGFHDSVMEAIHREATALPPIPFPWTRAWPALAATAVAVVGWPVLLATAGSAGLAVFDGLLPAAKSFGAPWIALALLVTAGSLLLSRRLADERF